MARRNLIACIVGQSNERGRRWLDPVGSIGDAQIARFGPPTQDPIPPKGGLAGPTTGDNGSWWPGVVNDLAVNRDIHLVIKNTAVGATSIVQDWLGDSVGDGTGTPKASGDAGFDPNSYLSDALSAVQEGIFDERWCFISIGQKDSGIPVTLANFQLAHENVANYFLDAGVKVAIGFTVLKPSAINWYTASGNPAIQSALSTFSSNTNVIAGANLFNSIGLNPPLYDAAHMEAVGYDRASIDWYASLVTGGW